MTRRSAASFLLALVLALFAGCSTYDSPVPAAGRLDGKKHFFVHSNLNDNHGIAEQIAGALKVRGAQAETGPLTMMPDEAQVIVTYEEHWTWDFGDRLGYLQLTARDRKSNQTLGVVRFSAKVPTRRPVVEVISDLVDQLLATKKA